MLNAFILSTLISFPWGVSSDLSNDIFYKVEEALQEERGMWVLVQASSF